MTVPVGLPPCAGEYGILPPSITPHPASLAEVEKRFVHEAPTNTRARRELIFRALALHLLMCRKLFSGHDIRVWLDGGFVTLKSRSPRDADIAILVPAAAMSLATKDAALPLWTMGNVKGALGENGPEIVTPKLHTGFGLTDTYVVNAENPAAVEIFRRGWEKVKLPDGSTVAGLTKGFVEVVE